jgi:hypothetical protein
MPSTRRSSSDVIRRNGTRGSSSSAVSQARRLRWSHRVAASPTSALCTRGSLIAAAISDAGYNAFVLKYRAGLGASTKPRAALHVPSNSSSTSPIAPPVEGEGVLQHEVAPSRQTIPWLRSIFAIHRASSLCSRSTRCAVRATHRARRRTTRCSRLVASSKPAWNQRAARRIGWCRYCLDLSRVCRSARRTSRSCP